MLVLMRYLPFLLLLTSCTSSPTAFLPITSGTSSDEAGTPTKDAASARPPTQDASSHKWPTFVSDAGGPPLFDAGDAGIPVTYIRGFDWAEANFRALCKRSFDCYPELARQEALQDGLFAIRDEASCVEYWLNEVLTKMPPVKRTEVLAISSKDLALCENRFYALTCEKFWVSFTGTEMPLTPCP